MIYSKPELLTMVLDKAEGADPALACSLIHILSQWQPNSTNVQGREDAESTWGLFQFTGQQARQMGYKGDFLNLLEPEVNISLGLDILRNSLAVANNRPDNALLMFLGRSRAMLIPAILSLMEPYKELLASRVGIHETIDSSDPAVRVERPN